MLSTAYSRRAFLATSASAAAVTAVALTPGRARADATMGRWSAPFEIGGMAIHATVVRTGEVLIFSYMEGDPAVDHTSWVTTWNPYTGALRDASFPYDRDIFCTGMTVLPNGKLYVAGGHDPFTGRKADPDGAAESDVYDPLTRKWTPGPVLTEQRWYPTVVAMPNGQPLIFGGTEDDISAKTVDAYDPVTGTKRKLPSSADKELDTYPRMHLAPDGRVVKTGPGRVTEYFNPVTSSWSAGPRMRFGDRYEGSSVLLAGGRQVLTFGGRRGFGKAPTVTAEVLDLSADRPKWSYTGSMSLGRIHANGVVLPDGTVLAVGGGTSGLDDGPHRTSELYDPVTGTWRVVATQRAVRMYHSTALLLPDGRVFSGGTKGSLSKTAEIYSPPYLFRGPRPTIGRASETVARGGTILMTSPQAAGIRSVALIRPGSTTHQVDTDQRHIPLRFRVTGQAITARLPANTILTPPGYYMLFVLNARGVPSIAKWVRLT